MNFYNSEYSILTTKKFLIKYNSKKVKIYNCEMNTNTKNLKKNPIKEFVLNYFIEDIKTLEPIVLDKEYKVCTNKLKTILHSKNKYFEKYMIESDRAIHEFTVDLIEKELNHKIYVFGEVFDKNEYKNILKLMEE